MGIKSFLIRPFAKRISKQILEQSEKAVETQASILNDLIQNGRETLFGKDHHFDKFDTYDAFKRQVPIRTYEDFVYYIEKVKNGEKDVLWKGVPKYFAKTSGTTSGVKYIPLTKDSMPGHFNSARNAMFHFAAQKDHYDFFDGKMIFLSGEPTLDEVGGIPTGRLSGIVNHEIPSWLRTNQLPSYETNCIEDWEQKVKKIAEETIGEDLRLISGIPPWVQMYFEKVLEMTGKKTIKEVFPNFSVFAIGGVNYEPYRKSIEKLIGFQIDTVETYPASEGFIAFQDVPEDPGLLLNTNAGIFFEFVPVGEIDSPEPTRIALKDVELGVNYAILISSNAGLWAYNIGDTIQFVSKDPYRILVTGRVKHFISAFGEHVIGKEVDESIQIASAEFGAEIVEYTVAPQINPPEGLPYHEWLIEFEKEPNDLMGFSQRIDGLLQGQNIYYEDLIKGKILRSLVITPLKKNSFRDFMRDIGKLGGQNKVPRLANDRKIADKLINQQKENTANN